MDEPLKASLEAISGSVRYQAWLYHRLQPALGRRVLDIGSGLGELPALFGRGAARAVIMSDADETLVARLRRRYEPAYRVLRFSVVDSPGLARLPIEAVDTITCINVLEHIRRDRLALRNMHALLDRGGKLLLIVPALPCLLTPLDRAVGHYRRYTRRHLNRKLQQAGFAVEQQRYLNFFGIFTWWFAGWILRRRALPARACAWLDRLVPWLERLEALAAPPIGQSLVTVCSKA